jgi:hypothetical protein
MSTLIELKNALVNIDHVKIFHESPDQFIYNAPHVFTLKNAGSSEHLGELRFQRGPLRETGINGISDEVLIAIVIDRLEHFQKGEFVNNDSYIAIERLTEALLWLKKRTLDRTLRGVEGFSKK